MALSRETRLSYVFLARWLAVAAAAGAVGAFFLQVFRLSVDAGIGLLSSAPIPAPVWAAAAALIVGGAFYRLEPEAAGEGIPSYLRYLNRGSADFPPRATFWKFPSALVTLAGFGCGGIASSHWRASIQPMSRPVACR